MKKFLSVFIVLLFLFSFTSLGIAQEEITLEFQQWWGVEMPDGALQEIVDGFTEETGIKIHLLSNPYSDTKTQIAAGAASKTMADVVGLDGSWVYDFAKQNAIADLSTLMEADGYDQSQLSDQIRVDGKTYMIPVVNFAYPMYVNMDLLERAGVEVPKTWDDFIVAIEKISALDPSVYGWAIPLSTEVPSGIQNNFMSWLWASGGSMLKDGKPNLVNNDDLIKVTEFVKKMFDMNAVTPGAFAMKEADMVGEFANGRVCFITNTLAHLTMIRKEAPDLNFDFYHVPVMPGYEGKSGMDVANWGIGIAENTAYKKEAMLFIEYMMSPEVNAKLAEIANAFPGNTKANPDYSSSDPLFVKAFELFKECYAINEFTGLPVSEDLMRSFNEELQLYIEGETESAEKALEAAQERWLPNFK